MRPAPASMPCLSERPEREWMRARKPGGSSRAMSVGTMARPRAGTRTEAAAKRSAATSPAWLTRGAIAASERRWNRTLTPSGVMRRTPAA
ncbi:hypothetical protein D3C87_1565490 [compost metagenome]